MIRDTAVFVHSLLHARFARPKSYYWDNASDEEMEHLVDLLSNTEDPDRAEIRRLLGELRPSTMLDAGCGPATELAGYKKHGLNFMRYTGMDQSEQMLRIASKRHPEATFTRGALERMPFEDGSFDLVLLKAVLEHQASYEAVVREGVRVAKEVLLINFFHRLLPLRKDVLVKDRRGFWNNWYAKGKFEAYLRTLPIEGFEVVRSKGTAKQTVEMYVIRCAKQGG